MTTGRHDNTISHDGVQLVQHQHTSHLLHFTLVTQFKVLCHKSRFAYNATLFSLTSSTNYSLGLNNKFHFFQSDGTVVKIINTYHANDTDCRGKIESIVHPIPRYDLNQHQ